MAKKRLGKGLEALLGSEKVVDSKGTKKNFLEVDVNIIKPNPYQPRVEINKAALRELKDSIKEKGVIQPIVVRKVNDTFELLAGERRLIAVKALGFEKVPALILDVKSKEEMLEIAIIENVQRENLNPIEVASGYRRLIDECDLTQEQVAAKVGVERSTVTNLLRLLKLPDIIKKGIIKDKISAGHARALLSLNTDEERIKLYNKIVENSLSVRNIEELVSRKKSKKPGSFKKTHKYNPVEDKLREILGTKVKIKTKKEGGTIEIEYYSAEDLNRLIEMFETILKNY